MIPQLQEFLHNTPADFGLLPGDAPDPLAHIGIAKDERSMNYPLMDLRLAIAIAVAYILSVKIGTWFMTDKKPWDLWAVRVVHNAVLMVLSAYMCGELFYQAHIVNGYGVFCNSIDKTEGGDAIRQVLWIFYASKVVEFIDTWVMVLRKKGEQINFLHLYHHSTIFIMWWCNVLYFPGGEGYFAAMFNSGIHVLMYGYYLLRTLDVECPWKKYITKFQIIQFISFVTQASWDIGTGCQKEINNLLWINNVYAFSLLALFMQFYQTRYKKAKSS